MIVCLKKMVGYLSGSKTSCTCSVIFFHMIFTATWSFAECYITTPTHNTTLFSSFMYRANSTYSQDCTCLFLSFCGSQTTLQISSASCRFSPDLSSTTFCMTIMVELLMLRLVVHCSTNIVTFCLCWIWHSVITVKYKVLESIVLALLISVCSVFSSMKLLSAIPAKIT